MLSILWMASFVIHIIINGTLLYDSETLKCILQFSLYILLLS